MLQLTTKWMTNSLAKKSIQSNDFIECVNNGKLFILSYGEITSSGKNTYNYKFIDSEGKESEGNNAYLDALTKLILGSSPKAKANKDASEANKPKEAKQTSKQTKKECLYLTFDEAFDKACNMIASYKEVAKLLGKYDARDAINLTSILQDEARRNETKRIKEAKKSEELKSLRQTLDLAMKQGNNMLVDAINDMIAKKEKE